MCLSDRMKLYENYNKQYLAPNQYVLMRLDGKNFSKFTKKYFKKPFDMNFIEIMQEVSMYLFKNISGSVAVYTQSDEITILLTDMKSKGMEGWFNYRLDKMCSIAASMATAKFNNLLYAYLFYKKEAGNNLPCPLKLRGEDIENELSAMPLPVFDCRCWNVPNQDEAYNVFLWRQRDCIRNSVLQYGQSFFSHKELMNKNIDEIKEMIKNKASDNKNLTWENLLDVIKYGTFFFWRKKEDEKGKVIINYSEALNKEINIELDGEFKNIFEDVVVY